MSKVETNPIITGLSGKLGNLVFRKKGDRIIMAKAPANNSEPTEKQRTHRGRFMKAASFAKGQLQNPEAKALYDAIAKRKGHDSAFAAAIQDFFNAPEVTEVVLTGYKGNINDSIFIHVTDDTSVTSVTVEIVATDGSVVETGDAIVDASGLFWTYKAVAANADFATSKVKVTVTDRPGNKTVKEIAM